MDSVAKEQLKDLKEARQQLAKQIERTQQSLKDLDEKIAMLESELSQATKQTKDK